MFHEAIASTYLLKHFCRYGYVVCTYFQKKQIQLYNVYASEMLRVVKHLLTKSHF